MSTQTIILALAATITLAGCVPPGLNDETPDETETSTEPSTSTSTEPADETGLETETGDGDGDGCSATTPSLWCPCVLGDLDGDGIADPGGECGEDLTCSEDGICVPIDLEPGDGDGDGDPAGDGDGDGCDAGPGVAGCPCYDGDLDRDGATDPGGECFAGLICDTSTMICVLI